MFYFCSRETHFWNIVDAPAACHRRGRLHEPSDGTRVIVAGLVILRQRPGTAKGVIFLTLEDETGVVNVSVWRKMFERFRRAVISGRLLRITGRVQKQSSVIHVVTEEVEDISRMLDTLPVLEERHLSRTCETG